jgi:hypothetical protein
MRHGRERSVTEAVIDVTAIAVVEQSVSVEVAGNRVESATADLPDLREAAAALIELNAA